MKIIDFERVGNSVRFYLGEDDELCYLGDDWNDAPYGSNAGSVYPEYVKGYVDMFWPVEYYVLEPDEDMCVSKFNLKDGDFPCIVVTNRDDSYAWSYEHNAGRGEIERYYFEDSLEKLEESPNAYIGQIVWL